MPQVRQHSRVRPRGGLAEFVTAHTVMIEQIERGLAATGLPLSGWYEVLLELYIVRDRPLCRNELARSVVLSRSDFRQLVGRL